MNDDGLRERIRAYHKTPAYRAYQKEYKKYAHKGKCRWCGKKRIVTFTYAHGGSRWLCLGCYGDMKLLHSRSMAFTWRTGKLKMD